MWPRSQTRFARLLSLLLLLVLAIAVSGCRLGPSEAEIGPAPPLSGPHEPGAATVLEVHFLNVGQGDAILIRAIPGQVVLIDGGPKAAGPGVVAYLKSKGVTALDLLVATHPHEDHIGGLPDVLAAFKVGRVIDSGVAHSTDIFRVYLSRIELQVEAGHCSYETPEGQEVKLASNVTLKVLGPAGEMSSLNNSSVVCRLDFGETSFLFPGDAEGKAEQDLLVRGVALAADVLKVAHHGAKTSTSVAFLAAVSPSYAVICVGPNTFGHPDPGVVGRLRAAGAVLYRTDTAGELVFTSDGSSLTATGSSWTALTRALAMMPGGWKRASGDPTLPDGPVPAAGSPAGTPLFAGETVVVTVCRHSYAKGA